LPLTFDLNSVPAPDLPESLITLGLSYPGAVLDHPWGIPAFKVGGKLFLVIMDSGELMLKSTPERQSVLVQDPSIRVAPYLGKNGWIALKYSAETHDLASDLIDQSYELVIASLPRKLRP
jgi:predicted DNA-binding protein (MmcQ/YjbR family)